MNMKERIEPGMVVTLRNGENGVVTIISSGHRKIITKSAVLFFRNYDENMRALSSLGAEYDVMAYGYFTSDLYDLISGSAFTPEWERKPHTIIIDGKTVELSEDSFQALKKSLL